MKLTCIGTDPAALYLGILLKRRDPLHAVRFIEDPYATSHEPTSLICNPLKPRFKLADAEVQIDVDQVLAAIDKVAVNTENRKFETAGLRHATIDPGTLNRVLRARAEQLGCAFEERHTIADLDAFGDADVIVAADGVHSRARALAKGFAPQLDRSSNRFVAFQSSQPADTLTTMFRTTPHGIFHAMVMPRGTDGSSIIVETPAEVLRVSGLDRAPGECIIAYGAKLFGLTLDRMLASSEGVWSTFAMVRNATWHAGKVVLLGRAAYTSHFSVGLDIRSQLEDAEVLAQYLSTNTSVTEALNAFETARRPKADSLQRAAAASLNWFEHVRRYAQKPFEQFVFSLLTSSMRITHARIDKAAPDLTRTVDSLVAGDTQGSNRPLPPMFAPIRLRDLQVPNRVVVSPMCQYSAMDGTVNDWHLVHLGSRAVGGAGLVIAEMTDVLPEGRISLHCAGMYSPEHVPAWKRVTDFVHHNSNSKIAVQLAHAGRKGS
ncbi:MAG: anthraniloyl-CoA monooxygenase, partial [Gammaproteobacteria bacterium]|nr:anthraniloyl-CoA monooxygenase [Gammaproteobacteria bacterium]